MLQPYEQDPGSDLARPTQSSESKGEGRLTRTRSARFRSGKKNLARFSDSLPFSVLQALNILSNQQIQETIRKTRNTPSQSRLAFPFSGLWRL